MDLTIERGALTAALALPCSVANPRSTMAAFQAVNLSTAGNKLVVQGLDEQMAVTCIAPASSTTLASVAVDGARLKDIVSRLDADRVRIGLQGGRLQLRAGKRSYLLSTSEYSVREQGGKPGGTLLPAPALTRVIKQVLFSACDDWTRPYIACVRIRVEGKTLLAMASDGHTAALARVELEERCAALDVCLPKTTAKRLLGALGSSGADDVAVLVDGPSVLFTLPGLGGVDTVIVARLNSAEQSPIERMAEGVPAIRTLVSGLRETLLEGLRSADLSLASGILMQVVKDGLRLTADGADAAGELVVPCDVQDAEGQKPYREPLRIPPKYLERHLSALDSEEAQFGFSGQLDPVSVFVGDFRCGLVSPQRP